MTDSTFEYRPNRSKLAKQFQEEFGKVNGSIYFAEGLTHEQAVKRHSQVLLQESKELEIENEKLRQKLSAIDGKTQSATKPKVKP